MNKNRKKSNKEFYPVALTIAGSDSGGGAGIQADLRTFNAFGIFGTSAITAITAQNPRAVSGIYPIPPEGVKAQINAVLDAFSVRYAKTGMLCSAETVDTVADIVKERGLKFVCDPVMVSTSGARLLAEDAVESVKKRLLPLAEWITPNIPEAELLLGDGKIATEEQFFSSALKLYELFGSSVLLKGGHFKSASNCGKLPKAVDAVCRNGKMYKLSSIQCSLPEYCTHGTGCTLSAAMTAAFAVELPWKEALCMSKAFIYGSLLEHIEPGDGLSAMYPPNDDYMNNITLEEIAF